MKIELNVGFNVGDARPHVLADVVRTVLFYHQDVISIAARVGQSKTEATAIVVYDVPDEPTSMASLRIEAISRALRQDCIAARIDGAGYLLGSNAAAWGGEFIPEYWLDF